MAGGVTGRNRAVSSKGARNTRSEQRYSNKQTGFQQQILSNFKIVVLFTESLTFIQPLIARKYDIT